MKTGKLSVDKRSPGKMICFVLVFCAATVIASPAATKFKSLVPFNLTNGANPYYGSLVQGTDGNFYGTTSYGGANTEGTFFKITPGGTLTTLYSFCTQPSCADGSFPTAGVVQGTDGNFYGTTESGGTGAGTVFKITAKGVLTTLHSFTINDGELPFGGLVQAANGILYGTTEGGGMYGYGTIFQIHTNGAFLSLYSFQGTDGEYPYDTLVQGTDGNLYGTTLSGGPNGGLGTVFKITTAGKLTTLHTFTGPDGDNVYSGLVQAADGSFYGTTFEGGTNGVGTVFQIYSNGTFLSLHSFANSDGSFPYSGLVQATDKNFYGTTELGGTNNSGTVFKITSGGVVTTLHPFNFSDGAEPYAGLVQGTSGTFFGSTYEGGSDDYGTLFSISVGLGPFVETRPISGKVGAAVIILGTNLTGATSVTFNAKSAKFKVVSKTEITTNVPTGATTGKVTVKTPSATLVSNVVFRVTK